MRLLVISNNPDRASFRQRIGVYLEMLRDRRIDSEVHTLPAGMLRRRRVFQAAEAFDGVLLHRKMLNAWDAFWLGRYARRVAYDFDDAIMYSDRKPERDSRLRFRRFGKSVSLSHLVIAGNQYLADQARKYNPNVCVLPTAVELGAYPAPVPPLNDGNVRLVWIGSRSTLRYLHEIAPALEELGRRQKNVVLRIICNEFLDLMAMGVEKRIWSKQTEAVDMAGSDIGLAPLPDNRFTRGKCGFKILQYQAVGLPVVASPVGVNGEYVRDGVSGFLATDRSQWIARLSELVQNAELRRTMGKAGRKDVERFDMAAIGGRFCELIERCLGHHDD
jgi:glycosyltransferase involved in cell wall biosynthesis